MSLSTPYDSAMSEVISIATHDQFDDLVSKDSATVVRYYADWCGACRIFDPIYRSIAICEEFREVAFCNVDCSDRSEEVDLLLERVKPSDVAMGLPCVAVFRNGARATKLEGYQPYSTLKKWLMEVLNVVVTPVPSPLTLTRSAGVMRKLHALEIDGKPVLRAIDSFDELEPPEPRCLVALYMKSRPAVPGSLWGSLERALLDPNFENVHFVTYNSDDDADTADCYLLNFETRCLFLRNGRYFCEWRTTRSKVSFEEWLSDCLSASEIAETARIEETPGNEQSQDNQTSETGDASVGEQLVEVPTEGSEQDADASDQSAEEAEEDNIEDEDDIADGEADENEDADEDDDAHEDDDSDEDEQTSWNLTRVSTQEEWQNILSANVSAVLTFDNCCEPFSQALCNVFDTIAGSSAFESTVFCLVDHDEELAEVLGHEQTPDIRVFRKQMEVARMNRALPRPEIEEWLAPLLNASNDDQSNNLTHDEAFTSDVASHPTEMKSPDVDRRKSVDEESAIAHQVSTVHISGTEKDDSPVPSIASVGSPVDSASETASAHDASPGRNSVESSPSITLSPSSDTSADSLFDRASQLLQNANGSSTSLTSVSTTDTVLSSLPRCTGSYQERPKSRFRWLGKRQPFHDPEPGCVFVPGDDGMGLEIGRANEENSYFNITLSQPQDGQQRDQLEFGMGFGPDPTMKTRFVSAVFRVSFGYDDDHGRRVPLKVRSLTPTDAHGVETEVHWGRGSESSLSISVGQSSVSLGGESKRTKNAEYTRKTSSRVRGQGVHTQTAEWTFQEDEGEAGRHGLDPQYQMSVTLPPIVATRPIWIEFWGKAVLARGRSLTGLDVTLKIGSMDEPYRRNIDMSSGISTKKMT